MKERRTYDPKFKARVVLELISGKKGLMEASREYQIKDSVLSRWKQEFIERAGQVFEHPEQTNGQAERVAELERLVGRLTLQLDMAKKYWDTPAFHRRKASSGARAARSPWLSGPRRLSVDEFAAQQLLLSQPKAG